VVELPEALARHANVIGEAIMQASPHIKGVFAKRGPVTGEYRLRAVEWIAGTRNTLTEHKENGRRYLVDIEAVYFSPRLSTERLRVAQMIPPSSLVLDLFAGVGPFSVLIASRGCRVIAVDINPRATELLRLNAERNKVSSAVVILTGDARQVPRDLWWGACDHVIMNLPGHAFEYLDLALGALRGSGGIIHFYCFAREPSPEAAAQQLLQAKLRELGAAVKAIHRVRRVRMAAPHEWQIGIDLSVSKHEAGAQ